MPRGPQAQGALEFLPENLNRTELLKISPIFKINMTGCNPILIMATQLREIRKLYLGNSPKFFLWVGSVVNLTDSDMCVLLFIDVRFIVNSSEDFFFENG